jgi:SAM-dependent methyltransferase
MLSAANDAPDCRSPALEFWFKTPLGRLLLEREQAILGERLERLYGYYLLQLSAVSDCDLAGRSAIRHRFRLSSNPGSPGLCGGVSRFEALPLEDNTIDVVLLHHVLEFSQQPHQVLREAYRVLMPRGQLLVLCINPWSLFGLRTRLMGSFRGSPWRGHLIGPRRMADWMSLLDLRVCGVHRVFHHLPVQAPGLLGRFGRLWRYAERYSLPGGGVYLIEARKEIVGLTPLRPRWRVWRPEIAPLGAANSSCYSQDK